MKRIVFGITGLTIGGAERVLVDVVNKLKDEFDVTIFTIYSGGELEKQVSSEVKIKSLYNFAYSSLSGVNKVLIPIKLFLSKGRIYKKHIKNQYDTEIAFLEGPITTLFSASNNKKIAWVHNDISLVFGTGIKAEIKRILNKNVYAKYNKIVFVSKDNLEKFNKIYNINVDKQVIYNYIDKENVIKQANVGATSGHGQLNSATTKNINILSIARLVPQKAIDRLAKVHAKLIADGYNHNIYIIGDGPEKAKINKIIQELNIQDTFVLLGKQENPYPYLNQADVFALLSSFEGYGIVIEEAKILNKYVIITDTAAREAVQNYPSSKIVANSEDGIYEGLRDLITNKDKYIVAENKFNYDNGSILDEIKEIL